MIKEFLITLVFSFIIGLEVRVYKEYFNKNLQHSFGSVRTFTLSGILGFILFKLSLYAFLSGFFVISLLYALHYYKKLQENRHSIVLFLVLLLTYSIGAISLHSHIWLPAAVFVVIVFVLSEKDNFYQLSRKIDLKEVETFAKLILLSAVILPLLPKKPLPYIDISSFKIWAIVVIVSLISYFGYILQKYFFANKGYFFTGIAGGMYSSTATTIVLATKAKHIGPLPSISAGIIAATGMMYLRILVIAYIFNHAVGKALSIPILIFTALSMAAAFIVFKKDSNSNVQFVDKNPLELKTAFVFAFLFIAMFAITKFIKTHFGNVGLESLSYIIGFTDIDPFILSILNTKINVMFASKIILIAISSNNILKAIYAVYFSGFKAKKSALILVILSIITLLYAYFML